MAEYVEREKVCKLIENMADGYKYLEVPTQYVLDKVKSIPTADVRPVVLCKDCKYNNACLTQSIVEDASIIPFDRNTFFCADGWRKADV